MAHVAPCGPVAFVQAVQLVRPLVLIELYDTNAYTMFSLFVIKKWRSTTSSAICLLYKLAYIVQVPLSYMYIVPTQPIIEYG